MGRNSRLPIIGVFVAQEIKSAESELSGAETLKDYGRACYLSGKIAGLAKADSIISGVLGACPKKGGNACGK